MKIAQVNTFFYPVIGGVEQYILSLCLELVNRGHEVHVFTIDKRHGKRIGPSEEEFKGIQIHRLPVLVDISYRVKFWPKLLDRLLHEDFDLFHTYCQGHFHTLASTLVSKLRNMPLVITTYGPLHKHAVYPVYKSFPLRLYDSLVTPKIFDVANKVLARNPLIVPWLKALKIEKDKIEVTLSGIPSDCLRLRNVNVFRKKHGLMNKKIVLYIGRINPQKGVQHLLKAVPIVSEKMSNVVFVFIGPDEIGYSHKLTNLSKKLNVADKVRFLPPIFSLEEEMEAYAACDVFVMPSSFEGFSQAIHKAWAQRRPVVATNVGFLSMQVEHGKDGFLVEYGDSKALADEIIVILQSSKLTRAFGINGWKKTRRYTFNMLAVDMEKIYYKIIEEKRHLTE